MRLHKINEELIINLETICSISCYLKGSECGASYQQKDEKFLVIVLSSGERFRFKQGCETAKELERLLLVDL